MPNAKCQMLNVKCQVPNAQCSMLNATTDKNTNHNTKGGGSNGKISHRRICIAESNDGITWTKPNLGVFDRNGSTANNIVLENSGVSVFIDGNPEAPASEKFKMACSDSAYVGCGKFGFGALKICKIWIQGLELGLGLCILAFAFVF